MKINRLAKIMRWVYKAEIELDELDLEILNDIHPEMVEDDEYCPHEELLIGDGDFKWSDQTHPVKIDKIIETLNQLKEKGCNYVEIFYHTDHMAYHLIGLDVHKASQESINEFEHEMTNILSQQREEKIKRLEAEIAKLKEEEKNDK